jgi:hypothetical protein
MSSRNLSGTYSILVRVEYSAIGTRGGPITISTSGQSFGCGRGGGGGGGGRGLNPFFSLKTLRRRGSGTFNVKNTAKLTIYFSTSLERDNSLTFFNRMKPQTMLSYALFKAGKKL